ncbi:MAG: ATP-dependent RecD-like DNA helicase [Mangrovibacterium sp.]
MIKTHISNRILANLPFEATDGQLHLANSLGEFIGSTIDNNIFLIKGYAGTGKTSMVSALVKALDEFKIQSMLLAPTGRAAKVLSTYSGKNAYTIHKKIYRQQATTDGMSRFSLDRNLHKDTFFLVDEASMLANNGGDASIFGSGRVLDDLYQYVCMGNNCKLILIGDTAQLPPIGMEISPALDASELSMYGVDVHEVELTEVVRQDSQSGILYNATALRELIAVQYFFGEYFPIELDGFPDVKRISGGELIDLVSACYDKYGEQGTMVVTRSNKRANKFNQGIRATVLYKEEQITTGDLIMVVKNNYFWMADDEKVDFIANGDTAEIVRIGKREELYGFHFADVTLRFADYDGLEVDCKILLDALDIETASLSYEDNLRLFHAVAEDYADIKSKKKRWERIKANPHFNALQVKFAYAVTCHKAQGGQWDAVFIDHGYLLEEMLNVEFLRWLYTAFTRSVKELYLVNFNKEFFGE